MIVSVRQRGGLFGIDRTISVDRRRLRIREEGRKNQSQLTEEQATRVRDLAARVARLAASETATARSGPDEMHTTVTIRRPAAAALRLTANDKSPTAVWDLVGALSDAAETTEPSR